MTTSCRQTVYVPDKDVQLARELGMMNLSGFVREKLDEFIVVQKANLRQNDSETTTAPGNLISKVQL